MPAFKDPSFQERAAAAAQAKVAALAKLRDKPPVDEEALAARTAARAAREAAEAEKRRASRAARDEAAAAKRAAAAEAAEAALAAERAASAPVLTEAERKAARDARYAARKKRKS